MLLSDYTLQVQTLVHDLQANDFTTNELTNYVNNARQRVALDLHCVRTFNSATGTFQGAPITIQNLVTNQEIYPITSGIPGCFITAPGTYAVGVIPTVTFTAPPAGVNNVTATGTATMNAAGTGVASIVMTNWGNGYTIAPTVTFSGGTPAAATAFLPLNVITINSITYLWPGSTNRQTLRWLPFTTFEAWARAYLGSVGSPTAWTTNDQMNQIYIYPVPDQPYVVEIDYVLLPTNLVNLTDTDTQVIQPYADAVQYYAAYIARSKLQDYEKADFWRKTYNTRVREINAFRQGARIPNIYRSGVRRMMRW